MDQEVEKQEKTQTIKSRKQNKSKNGNTNITSNTKFSITVAKSQCNIGKGNKTMKKTSNTNVNIINFVYRRFRHKTWFYLIVLKIIGAVMLLIVTFDADSYGIVVPLNNIVIKITPTIYNYCCILHCVQFDNFLRKLIKFYKNWLLRLQLLFYT